MITCAYFLRALVFPTHQPQACPLKPKRSAKWWTVFWRCRPEPASFFCPRSFGEEEANIKRKSWTYVKKDFKELRLMGRFMRLTRYLTSIRKSTMTLKWLLTVLS